MLAVDWNSLAVENLRENYFGHILQLHLTTRDAAKRVHQACEHHPGTLLTGIPCQPHSQQGMQLGSEDVRAEVLWHGLRIAYMLMMMSKALLQHWLQR